MGVKGLWKLLTPVARPTRLESLAGKRLAVDASIWLHQFLKAMGDKEGNALQSAHIIGFFRRICKLLFYGIRPVFVFDGGVPTLKKRTVEERKKRKSRSERNYQKAAEKLLEARLKMHALQALEREKEATSPPSKRPKRIHVTQARDDVVTSLPDTILYADDLTQNQPAPSAQPVPSTSTSANTPTTNERKRRRDDEYELPDMTNNPVTAGNVHDPRLASQSELETFLNELKSQVDVSSFDINSQQFKSLPVEAQYEILANIKAKSRETSYQRLEWMLRKSKGSALNFSKLQIEGLVKRNELTQHVGTFGKGVEGNSGFPRRIASERGKEYVLVKDEGPGAAGWKMKPVEKNVVKIDDDDEDLKIIEVKPEKVSPSDSSSRNKGPRRFHGGLATDDDEEDDLLELFGEEALLNRAIMESLITAQHERSGSSRQEAQPIICLDSEDEERTQFARKNDLAFALERESDQDNNDDEDEEFEEVQVKDLRQEEQKKASSKSDADTRSDSEDFEEVPINAAAKTEPSVTFSLNLSDIIAARTTLPKQQPDLKKEEEDKPAFIIAQKPIPVAPKSSRVRPESQRLLQDMGPALDLASVYKLMIERAPSAFRSEFPHYKSLLHDAAFSLTSTELRNEIMETVKEAESKRLSPLRVAGLKYLQECLETILVKKSEGMGSLSIGGSNSKVFDADNVLELEEDFELKPVLEINLQEKQLTIDSDNKASQNVAKQLPAQKLEESSATNETPNSGNHRHMGLRGDTSDEDEEQHLEFLLSRKKNVASIGDVDGSIDLEEIVRDASITTSAASEEITDSMIDTIMVSRLGDQEEVAESKLAAESTEMPEQLFVQSKNSFISEEDHNVAPATSITTGNNDSSGIRVLSESIGSIADEEEYSGEEPDLDVEVDEESENVANEVHGPIDVPSDLGSELHEYLHEDRGANNDNNVGVGSIRATEKEIEQRITGLQEEYRRGQRDASNVTAQMTQDIQDLLRQFGIPYVTAPFEAEAQCARLLERDLVDGVITDDSDIFLFGGRCVYKNMFNQTKFVECYRLSDLENVMMLNRCSLIRMAYLLGSDYTEGIPHVGVVSAMEILKEWCSSSSNDSQDDALNDDIANGKISLAGLEAFKKWCSDVRKGLLSSKEMKPSARKFRKLASKLEISAGFPDRHVAEAYLRPIVDEDETQFEWGIPDLEALRTFMKKHLGWDAAKVNEVVLPVIRQLNDREKLVQQSLDDFVVLRNPTAGKHVSQRVQKVVNSLSLKKKTASSPGVSDDVTGTGSESGSESGSGSEEESNTTSTKNVSSNKTRGRGRGRGGRGRGGGGGRGKKSRK